MGHCSNAERSMSSIGESFQRKEMQNKEKNNSEVTKLSTAKLVEIGVANCKKVTI